MLKLELKLILCWVKSTYYFPFLLLLTCPFCQFLLKCVKCVCFPLKFLLIFLNTNVILVCVLGRSVFLTLYCSFVGVWVRGLLFAFPCPVLIYKFCWYRGVYWLYIGIFGCQPGGNLRSGKQMGTPKEEATRKVREVKSNLPKKGTLPI
jgi:hypothetical protein